MLIDKFIYLLRLKKDQWKKGRELEDIQLRKLKAIVRYTYDYVPYYHQLFKSAGFKPGDLKNRDDLKKIPISTRKDLQRNYPNTIAKGLDLSKQSSYYTSGSTGTPLRVIKDKKAEACHYANDIYTILECGVSLRDTFVYITSAMESIKTPRFYSMLLGDLHTYVVPVYDENERIVNVLKQLNPDAIEAFPSVLTDLSASDVSGMNPKAIFAIAENLPQHCRDVVRRTFNVEINELYGAVEFAHLAFECNKHTGLHVITDSALLEFLDEDQDHVAAGEAGEIVVTGLLNHAMPFIRYRVGDVGIPSDETCSCGRGWPLIKNIEGRTNDYLVLPSGRKMSPFAFYRFFYKEMEEQVFGISQFQIIQENRNKLLLKVVRGKEFNSSAIERIRKKIEAIFVMLGEEVEVDAQTVDKISRGRTGKWKTIISFAG